MTMSMEEPEARARAALAADGRDAEVSLARVRLRPDRAAAFRADAAFVKVYLGPGAEERARAAHAGQARAARLPFEGGPLAPAPGPLADGAFAMDFLEAERFGAAMRKRFQPRRRAALLVGAGRALAALHDGEDGAEPGEARAIGGWPATKLQARVNGLARPPWRGFRRQAEAVADALWAARETPTPFVRGHGDMHVENVLVGPRDALRLIDFHGTGLRPAVIEIAGFLASAASRSPLGPFTVRGETGLARKDEAAFFEGYGPRFQGDRLLTLHVLRAALLRAMVAADRERRGPDAKRGARRRRLRRLRRVVDAGSAALLR